MPRVGIALGSNVGDRMANIHKARLALREIAVQGEAFLCAPIYQTEPRLCPPGSPDFYNTVVELSYHGSEGELLEVTQAMEKNLGRLPSIERNAPRVIDVDLLYFGDALIRTRQLILPHPRLAQRRFVLQPLAAIRPELLLPGQVDSVAELLEKIVHEQAPLVIAAE